MSQMMEVKYMEYKTHPFPVPCETGVYADAATGEEFETARLHLTSNLKKQL